MVTFSGPCKSSIHVQISGNLVAPNEFWTKTGETWIIFQNINSLTVDGQGTIDGRGKIWWGCVTKRAELIEPAMKGTLNVLGSCKKAPSVKRVVVTSSMAAVTHNSKPKTPDVVVDETWFSSPDLCKETKSWYVLSKTLAEEVAWKYAKENGIDVVTINPAMVIGPLLQPTLNASSAIILKLIDGMS